MALYGLRDAADLVLIDRKTGFPALRIDYANATSSEWSSDSVYAKAKGANVIRWDNEKQGTLTLDTEVFDFGLLAMTMGSDIVEGRSDIFMRKEYVVDKTMRAELSKDGSAIDEKSISVVKLKGVGDTEHDGLPLLNKTSALEKLPAQVKNVTVSVNSKTANISFDKVAGATEYQIFRDGSKIATVNGRERTYTDTGLTHEHQYTYEVLAVNEFGTGAKSAKVKPTTPATGVMEYTSVKATKEDKQQALSNQGVVAEADEGAPAYTFSNGTITFTNVVNGEVYAIYYMEETDNVRTLTIEANKFPGNYEIYGMSKIRNKDTGEDEMVQFHYLNAKPQSNFTLTQSASEPTSLSIKFDLFPVDNVMMEYKAIK